MMTFDEQVKALREKVVPKATHKKKGDCTPSEWAGHLDYMAARHKANPEERRAASKKWRKANPEKQRAAIKAWQKANPEKVSAWRKANLEKIRAVRNKSKNKRRQNDPVFRMLDNLRCRQWHFFKGKTRSISMVRDMGCTQEFFRQRIESRLTGEMTLENYGKVWHLDHIFPLSQARIAESRINFLAAANWRNIQPMLGPENEDKSDEVTPDAQALFDQLKAEFAESRVAA